ncbi:MAG: potassium channel family protein [Gaiella sp.]|nr:potassium channel family protein [Gaiella sp.]
MRRRLEERIERGLQELTILRAIWMVAVVTMSLALVAAIFERLVDPGIGTFRNALWWAITTVTTTGYGDVVPTSTPGRIVGSLLMVAGVSAIPIAASLIVSAFVARVQAEQSERDRLAREEVSARLERIEQALAAASGVADERAGDDA